MQMISQAVEASRHSGGLARGTVFIQQIVQQTVREANRSLQWGLATLLVLLLGVAGYVGLMQIQHRREGAEIARQIAAAARESAERVQASAKAQTEKLQAVEAANKKAQDDLEAKLRAEESARSQDVQKISALRSELLTARSKHAEIATSLKDTRSALEQKNQDLLNRLQKTNQELLNSLEVQRAESRKDIRQATEELQKYVEEKQAAAPAPSTGPLAPRDDDGIRQTVARIAYTSGRVSFSRGDDPDQWQDAIVNIPLALGDRLWAEKGARTELQTPGGRMFVAEETQLSILNLQEDVAQLSLTIGTAAFRIRQLADGEIFEVDTPNTAVTFRAPGQYRIRVDDDGSTRVDVSEGSAVAAVGRETADVHGDQALLVRGLDAPTYRLESTGAPDPLDSWADEREPKVRNVSSRKVVGDGIAGVEDLDADGEWEEIPEYGMAWSPNTVAPDWAPYVDGRWTWQDPWGWSWVSHEPWGWAPYHYGSWALASQRWWWVPEGPRAGFARYAPARVAFVGGGPGGVIVQGGSVPYVGWFPLHPRDPFVRWWGPGAAVTVTNVTYGNRSFVTVVERETFIGGGFVLKTHLRDPLLLRGFATAPVFHGPLPFVPTVNSVRFAPQGPRHNVVRPPEKYLGRHVTTQRQAPPPPHTFEAKQKSIQANNGRPVARPEIQRPSPHRPPDRISTGEPRPMPPHRPDTSSGSKGHLDKPSTRPSGPAVKAPPSNPRPQAPIQQQPKVHTAPPPRPAPPPKPPAPPMRLPHNTSEKAPVEISTFKQAGA